MVGRPNVGKSTLTNALIGEKIAIMSDRPQTTRNKIMCILNTNNAQIMFLDTPDIHKPHHKLGQYMVRAAESTLKDRCNSFCCGCERKTRRRRRLHYRAA